MDQGTMQALAQWLADVVNTQGSLTTQEAITLLREKKGATELSALLVLAQALERGLVQRDPRALERLRSPHDEPISARSSRDTRPCVMIVEDDTDVRDSISEALEAEGYRVYAAADGAEALRMLARVPTPSLILLDLMMPVMDGWELLGRLTQDPRLAAVPVAIVSASQEKRPREMRFIRKPINLVSLIETVEELRSLPHRRSA